MKTKFLQALATVSIVVSALTGVAHAAGSAHFSLNPSSGSYTQNSSFSVQVRENGSAVNVVTAKLTYDASKLSCNSVNGSAAFPSTISTTCGGGSVTISEYVAPGSAPVDGDQLVGTINFTALASTGSSSVTFAAGSQIASNGTNTWDGQTTGGTYSFTAPAGGMGGGGSTGGSTGSTGGTSAGGSTTKTTAPQVANPGVVATNNQSATTPATDSAQTAVKAESTTAPVVSAATSQKTPVSKPASRTATWIVSGIVLVALAIAGAFIWMKRYNKQLFASVTSKLSFGRFASKKA
ncbi:MAG: hypothetical protein JWS12_104 [Candidatus Saccharibacteria bacterium]|nr:hypothetical protein [Candidatus Saccharibacteria bacterium]